MKQAHNLGEFPDGNIRLVAADVEDENFLAEVYFSTRCEEFAAVGWDEAQLRPFLELQYNFQKQSYRMQFPAADRLIILRGDEKIGRMLVDRNSSEIRLVDISLLPEFRAKGIGTKLVRDLLREAGEKDLPVTLTVAVQNQPALGLYQKLGFVITGTDELYHSMEWSG